MFHVKHILIIITVKLRDLGAKRRTMVGLFHVCALDLVKAS